MNANFKFLIFRAVEFQLSKGSVVRSDPLEGGSDLLIEHGSVAPLSIVIN